MLAVGFVVSSIDSKITNMIIATNNATCISVPQIPSFMKGRERLVWLFQAKYGHVQSIPAPSNPLSCNQSICPTRPIGMLSTLHAVVLSVHGQGRIWELTDLSHSLDSPDSESSGPVYWCLSSSLITSSKLHAGCRIVLHNIWYLPLPSSTETPTSYEALLVLGVYSTCQVYQSTDPSNIHRSSSFSQIPCKSECCTNSRLVAPDALHPIDVRVVLSFCMSTWTSVLHHFKVGCCPIVLLP